MNAPVPVQTENRPVPIKLHECTCPSTNWEPACLYKTPWIHLSQYKLKNQPVPIKLHEFTCPVGTMSCGCRAAELMNNTCGCATTLARVAVATDVAGGWNITVPWGSTCSGAAPTVAADTASWLADAFSAVVSWLRTAVWLACCCCCCCLNWASCHYNNN